MVKKSLTSVRTRGNKLEYNSSMAFIGIIMPVDAHTYIYSAHIHRHIYTNIHKHTRIHIFGAKLPICCTQPI